MESASVIFMSLTEAISYLPKIITYAYVDMKERWLVKKSSL